jgi:uridine kinase
VLSTDDYLPDYEHVAEHERDDPRHADFATLHANVASLIRGHATHVPVWSFHTHRREGERLVEPARVIVVEGIHALHASVRDAWHMSVYVDAPRQTRWERWEHLERMGVRGWGVEKARVFFDRVAEPTFARFEAEYRAAAQIVVTNHAM